MKDEQKQFYKKNLLFIVIDGLNYSMVNRMINGSPVCPYISGLAKNNISFQNVYSQGSYTMSAINSLFTGEDTIHENIYDSFFGSHSQSVFDEFINSGYESFIFMPGMNLPKSKHVSRFEHMYFFEEEDAFCYFKYQFEYYKNIYEKGGMTDKDYERLEYLLDSIFDGLKYIISPAENVVHMMRLADYPWVEYEKSFENELGKYINDKNGYIRNVLSDLDGCTLFNDTFRCAGNYLPKEIIEKGESVFRQNLDDFKSLRQKRLFHNLRLNNNPGLWAADYFMRKYTGSDDKRSKEKLISYKQRVFDDYFTEESISTGCKENRFGMCSAETIFNVLSNDLKNRDQTRPYFSYVHLDDTHQPYSYFSLLEEESLTANVHEAIEISRKLINEDHSYNGSFPYLLSASYVDRCLEKFIGKLNAHGDLSNTVVVITSDHGSVFGDSPIRDLGQGNNYHEESYHIPFIMVDYDCTNVFNSSKYFESKDIFPTLFNYLGIDCINTYDGVDMLTESSRGWAHGEHLGSGTADIFRMPILYTIRDDNRLIVCRAKITERVSKENIIAIYDRTSDKYELKNKRNILLNDRFVDLLLEQLINRHDEIVDEFGNG